MFYYAFDGNNTISLSTKRVILIKFMQKCISGSPVGVVLVLDSSGSIGPHNWQVTLKFATDVVIGLREKAKENLSKAQSWDYKQTANRHNLKGIFTSVKRVVCYF